MNSRGLPMSLLVFWTQKNRKENDENPNPWLRQIRKKTFCVSYFVVLVEHLS